MMRSFKKTCKNKLAVILSIAVAMTTLSSLSISTLAIETAEPADKYAPTAAVIESNNNVFKKAGFDPTFESGDIPEKFINYNYSEDNGPSTTQVHRGSHSMRFVDGEGITGGIYYIPTEGIMKKDGYYKLSFWINKTSEDATLPVAISPFVSLKEKDDGTYDNPIAAEMYFLKDNDVKSSIENGEKMNYLDIEAGSGWHYYEFGFLATAKANAIIFDIRSVRTEFYIDDICLELKDMRVLGNATPVPTPRVGVNLLEDAGFDVGFEQESFTHDKMTHTTTNELAHSGQRSLKIGSETDMSENFKDIRIKNSDENILRKGYVYKVSFWAYYTDASCWATSLFGERDSIGNIYDIAVEGCTSTDQKGYLIHTTYPEFSNADNANKWIFVEKTVIAQKDYNHIGFLFHTLKPMYIDDLRLEEVDTILTPFVPAEFKGDGTKESPYEIGSLAELQALSKYVKENYGDYSSAYFLQTADIDMSSCKDWTPIGSEAALCNFKGHYDGGNHKIINFNCANIEKSEKRHDGLFGYIKNATIKNLKFEGNSNFSSKNSVTYAGLVAGTAVDSTIDNCHASGNVIMGVEITGNAGVIVGTADGCTITNCSNKAEAQLNGVLAGGICGSAGDSTIEYCSNEGLVTINGFLNFVGGIVGTAVANSTVSKCFNKAELRNENEVDSRLGGIVGILSESTVSDCYNISPIVVAGVDAQAGGIVATVAGKKSDGGYDSVDTDPSVITRTYSAGKIVCNKDNAKVGGIIGVNEWDRGEISNSYYLDDFAIENSYATKNDIGTLLTVEQMMDSKSFEDFDFENVWEASADNSSYPRIRKVTDAKPTVIGVDIVVPEKVGINKAYSMKPKLYPADAADKSVQWQVTNDSGEATISADGSFNATKPGKVKLKVVANGGYAVSKEVTVNVLEKVDDGNGNDGQSNDGTGNENEGQNGTDKEKDDNNEVIKKTKKIKFIKKKVVLKKGRTATLKVKLTGIKKVKFKVAKKSILKIVKTKKNSAKVKGKKKGKTTVRATAAGKTTKCTVVVKR